MFYDTVQTKMKVLAQWRKAVARLKALWNASGSLTTLSLRLDTAQAASAETVLAFGKRISQAESEIASLNKQLADIQHKQLADLRAIVANIREESKRGPLQARSAAHLRQFVSATEEEV
jgi:peptidoglycan hydrolase CwlO-like protein